MQVRIIYWRGLATIAVAATAWEDLLVPLDGAVQDYDTIEHLLLVFSHLGVAFLY